MTKDVLENMREVDSRLPLIVEALKNNGHQLGDGIDACVHSPNPPAKERGIE